MRFPLLLILSVIFSIQVFPGNILSNDAKIAAGVKDSIFLQVDEMPQFHGGESGLHQYISNNLMYPPRAADFGIQGNVVARFVVDAEGMVKNVEIVRKLNDDCDKEVVRVIEKMPRWKPGKLNGENVSVYFTIPVKFRLPGDYSEPAATQPVASEPTLYESKYGPANSVEEFITNIELFLKEVYSKPVSLEMANDYNVIATDFGKYYESLSQEQLLHLQKLTEEAAKEREEFEKTVEEAE